MDSDYQWIVRPVYRTLTPFTDGVAVGALEQDDDFQSVHHILTIEGTVAGQFTASRVSGVPNSGRILATKDGRTWFFVDYSGSVVIDGFEVASPFGEGLAFVYRNGDGRYIDPDGNTVIRTSAERGSAFREGLASVQFSGEDGNSKWGVLDASGNVVLLPGSSSVFPFSEGFAVATVSSGTEEWEQRLHGYVNQSLEWVIDPIYRGAYPFHKGVAIVQTEAPLRMDMGFNSQLIDVTGRVIVDFPEAWLFPFDFREGFVPVGLQEMEDSRPNWGIVDTSGQLIVPLEFSGELEDVGFDGRYWHLLDRIGNRTALFDTEEAELLIVFGE